MRESAPPIITLLTDFGISDTYVASMKGVILGIHARARLVDVTHLVPPQQVSSGAFLLASYYRDFPPGTIHLAVVDPGVGSARRALAIRAGGHLFIGPDNGIFSFVLDWERSWEAREIAEPRLRRYPLSATFHGRDLFAPAAAHLAEGFPFEGVGPRAEPLLPDWHRIVEDGPMVQGRIIHFDHFGNAVSNISAERTAALSGKSENVAVEISGLHLPIHRTYTDVAAGEPLALIGSSGYLEICINRGSAREQLQLELLNEVRLSALGRTPY